MKLVGICSTLAIKLCEKKGTSQVSEASSSQKSIKRSKLVGIRSPLPEKCIKGNELVGICSPENVFKAKY